VITVEELSFGYKPTELIFDNVTFQFPSGETTVVTGRSGSGKSTLLYILGLLLTPSRGRVVLNGADVAGLGDVGSSRLRAARMGFVFQDAVLDPSRTVVDNVCESGLYAGLNRGEARDRALELLERFEVGLMLDHRPGEVSGGQAQRVALCRALLNRPEVILADEPTGNLDRESAALVLTALTGAARDGAVVVIASHDSDVVSKGDRVIDVGHDDG
jgi:putative ABC transport system ATP-binding protein/lipoprotein-releasing system ATP-binding protein